MSAWLALIVLNANCLFSSLSYTDILHASPFGTREVNPVITSSLAWRAFSRIDLQMHFIDVNTRRDTIIFIVTQDVRHT